MGELYINTNFNKKVREKDYQVEQADNELELYETIDVDDEIPENKCIAASCPDKSNSGLNGDYRALQNAPKQTQKTEVSKTIIYTTNTKQIVMVLLLVIVSVLMSSASLVIAFTNPSRVEPIDGSWSGWESWGECSTTCDVGLQTRHRNCSSPTPQGQGRQCIGDANEYQLCMSTNCSEITVAFNVYQSSANDTTVFHTVIFTEILLNEGEAYNKTDGIFTAPFSGLYQFNGQVCTTVGDDADYTLKIEGKSFASGEHMTPKDAGDGKCTSFSVVASVLKGEKVWIASHHLFANNNDWNSFSGILIHKT